MLFNRSVDRVLCGCFVALAIVCFVIRGPLRAVAHSNDFAAIYTSCIALLHGRDPYDPAVVAGEWRDAGGPVDRAPTQMYTPSVYSPSTFVTMLPLALLNWRWAQLAMLTLNLVLIALLLEALRRIMQLRWDDNRMLLLAGITISLRGFASAVQVGQLSILVTTLGAIGVLLSSSGAAKSAGILYGLGLSIKAPVAMVFFVFAFFGGRWKSVLICLLVVLLITAVGALRLIHQPWLGHWLDNLHSASAPGGVNDSSPANPTRIQLIHLQYPLSNMISARTVVSSIVVVVTLLYATPAALVLRRRPFGTAVLLPLSCMCLVELLAIYHRTYDSTLLVFPLGWALLPGTRTWQRVPVLLLLMVFVLPGAGMLAAHERPFLENVFAPRDAWAIFLLAGWLAFCLSISAWRREAPVATTAPGISISGA